jgi:hypothetical protein
MTTMEDAKTKEKREMRKVVITMLLIAAAISGGWGYWGMFTKEGNHKYDEMDGIYPFMGLAFSCLLALIALILVLIAFFSRKK